VGSVVTEFTVAEKGRFLEFMHVVRGLDTESVQASEAGKVKFDRIPIS
jgi:hypothetical protein